MFHYAEWLALGKPAYTAELVAKLNKLDDAARAVAKMVIGLAG